ncbi:hypothetical protein HPB48_011822 [Haemaphysalis longicornis]|uniref:Uncharacterized protein n=1 Tax=Haemaphysalis longicornis TaxID=44386 RepID=A0A9J6H5D9_HAELO|nr:hypothetical protein HPB48_011822 [Haemaphysalis longicornis]
MATDTMYLKATEKLLALGVHNTFQEHEEAQFKAQTERLMQTPTGRTLLHQLGYSEQIREMSKTEDIRDEIHQKFHMTLIPKNMDANIHQGRREARADFICCTLSPKNNPVYVDTATQDARKGRRLL